MYAYLLLCGKTLYATGNRRRAAAVRLRLAGRHSDDHNGRGEGHMSKAIYSGYRKL